MNSTLRSLRHNILLPGQVAVILTAPSEPPAPPSSQILTLDAPDPDTPPVPPNIPPAPPVILPDAPDVPAIALKAPDVLPAVPLDSPGVTVDEAGMLLEAPVVLLDEPEAAPLKGFKDFLS